MALPIASVSLLAIALSEFSTIYKCYRLTATIYTVSEYYRNHTYTFRASSFDFIGMAGSGRLQILASPGEAAFSRL